MGLDLVELGMEIEEQFGITIRHEAAGQLGTVGGMHRCLLGILRQRDETVDEAQVWETFGGLWLTSWAWTLGAWSPRLASLVTSMPIDGSRNGVPTLRTPLGNTGDPASYASALSKRLATSSQFTVFHHAVTYSGRRF